MVESRRKYGALAVCYFGAVGFFEMIENCCWRAQLSEYNCIYCHKLHTFYPKIVPEPLLVVGVGELL